MPLSVGHDFSRLPVGRSRHTSNGATDDEAQESVNLPIPSTGGSPSAQQATWGCPRATRVDTVTDLTQAGLQAGYLSAYGIIARMQVLPDSTNWDGKQIIESVSQESSTCPASLTRPGPCNGNSTFTVGAASGASALAPQQPAMRNRFYDYHTTRSRSISFLHDPVRNPAGLNVCETVCRQDYLCDGLAIGSHEITRRFRKGVFNGRDVTIVDVTKIDLVSGPGDFPERTLPRGQEYASTARESGAGELA